MERKNWRILLFDEDEDDFIMIYAFLSEVENLQFALDWRKKIGGRVEEVCMGLYDVVLIDHDFTELDPFDLIEKLHRSCPSLPIIFGTAWPDFESVAIHAKQSGAAIVVNKMEMNRDILVAAIQQAIK